VVVTHLVLDEFGCSASRAGGFGGSFVGRLDGVRGVKRIAITREPIPSDVAYRI
jgi:hypothetical protein